jgi:hypothetical protein
LPPLPKAQHNRKDAENALCCQWRKFAPRGEPKMTEAKPKRRWFRFSLRTLLLLVALAAVGSWAYWIGWPMWMAYREQYQFEAAVLQLKINDGYPDDVHRLPRMVNDAGHFTDDSKFHYKVGKYVRSNFSYCLVFTFRKPAEPSGQFECVKVSAYRLKHAPLDYRPYRDRDLSIYNNPTSAWIREIEYLNDFEDFILGNPEDGRHFHYELIYSDPPTK